MHTPDLDNGLAVRIFVANEHVNQLLLARLDPAVWQAKPPGRVRTIAAIFTHMHNVRTKWIRLSAPQLRIPAPLRQGECTVELASAALAESAERCGEMLVEAREFRRDGWAAPWPAGPEMLCYMIAHEAHHRGQVCLLAHQLGYRLPDEVTAGMWSWERL
jgi:uncharacterized damage-inducible protein DinB